jgi:hypothetical protein
MAAKYGAQSGERRIGPLTSNEIEDWLDGLTFAVDQRESMSFPPSFPPRPKPRA